MKTRIALIGCLALTAAGAAQAQDYDDWARVRSATPEYERMSVPEQRCHTEYVPVSSGYRGDSYAGPVIGGIAGGLLGSTIGKGNGKVAAAAAGAVVGSIVGANVQGNRAYAGDGVQPVQRCETVERFEKRLSGYQVVYEYAGRSYETVLPYDPGPRMRVRVAVQPVTEQVSGRYPERWEN